MAAKGSTLAGNGLDGKSSIASAGVCLISAEAMDDWGWARVGGSMRAD
ncbi:MAG: hypothetical protein JNK38_14525 [Acidobacteria bacterium]|nr:hypothetical protein [Acidobacteriota bacterium]